MQVMALLTKAKEKHPKACREVVMALYEQLKRCLEGGEQEEMAEKTLQVMASLTNNRKENASILTEEGVVSTLIHTF